MINPNVLYRVTGRYKDGANVIGYHFVGEDGSETSEYKEDVIWLINQGVIVNMRLQEGEDDELIIRGKGVNLNNLPVVNINKLRNKNNSPANGTNSVCKYTILRRILYNGQCMGYEVQDSNGDVKRKKRDQVIQLAVQKLVTNAEACKYTKEGSDIPSIGLSGVGCDLRRLPILIVNEQGKIIDPKADMSTLTVRGIYLRQSGLLHDKVSNKGRQFKPGDFLICNPDGSIDVQSKLLVEQKYTRDYERGKATCDDYIGMRNHYFIEIFGGSLVELTPNVVKSWAILKPHK